MLLAGIGNMFCGDDGFGPEVVRRMIASGSLPSQVRAVDYGIRGMHLAYDLLDGYQALLIVDTVPGEVAGDGPGEGEPGDISVLEVGEEDLGAGDFDPHGMAPVGVLGSLASLGGRLPPTYVIGCRPADTGEGIGLSQAVEAAVPVAMETVRTVLRERVPDLAGAEKGAG